MPYPTEIDDLTTPGPTLDGPAHSSLHNELRAAVLAIEQELATDPSGSFGSVRARLDALTAQLGIGEGEVTSHNIAGGAVTYDKLNSAIWNPLYQPWSAYNHDAHNISAGVGYVRGFHKKVGTVVHVRIEIKFGAGSALTGPPSFAIPFFPKAAIASGSAAFIRFGLTPLAAGCYISKAAGRLYVLWPGTPSGHWESGVEPSQGTDGDEVSIDIAYESNGVPPVGALS